MRTTILLIGACLTGTIIFTAGCEQVPRGTQRGAPLAGTELERREAAIRGGPLFPVPSTPEALEREARREPPIWQPELEQRIPEPVGGIEPAGEPQDPRYVTPDLAVPAAERIEPE